MILSLSFAYTLFQSLDHTSTKTTLIFFQFFEFYQIHKLTYDLDLGRAFYAYLSEVDTEIFIIIEKFNDPEGKCKGVIDYQVCFIVNQDG